MFAGTAIITVKLFHKEHKAWRDPCDLNYAIDPINTYTQDVN